MEGTVLRRPDFLLVLRLQFCEDITLVYINFDDIRIWAWNKSVFFINNSLTIWSNDSLTTWLII